MAVIFDIITATLLLAVTLYGVLLVWRNWQESRMASAYFGEEIRLLNEQIERQQQLSQVAVNTARDAWDGFRKFELRGKVLEADGICSFYFAPHDGRSLPPFHPGQYLTFSIKLPNEDKPLIRCYSLSDSPNHPDYYRVTIKREVAPRDNPDAPDGKSSTYFHRVLNPDDIIDIKAPSGHFYLNPEQQNPVVLIGGGIGITPVLSMLNTITAAGSSNREVWFFYGARDGSEIVMKDHFQQIAREHPNVRMNICLSRPRPEDQPGTDFDHQGRVSVELFKQLLPSNNFDYYICGPAPLMDSLTTDLYDWGVPKEKVHFEAFGPATVKSVRDAETDTTAAEAEKPVMIHLKRSKKDISWTNQAGSILECAEAAGASLESGCRAGNCGACELAVVEGSVTYLSDPGAPVADGSCLACVAIPEGNLVIDA
ncbi:MAG: 2Fe-2S iron-sulfur cluster-binding protein [Immundisolibacteraceae bacterium]|nr:2Fe-2S iron-sulfur cluster-binding protein [Immundisolibacteraceae bacterium]